MATVNFADYSTWYDLINQEKDYAAEAGYIDKLVRKYVPLAKNMLELGSGTGNHAAYFVNKGFTVTGIEKSEQMNQVARSKMLQGFTPRTGDMTRLNETEQFDCAISLFHVMSYVTANEDFLSVLQGVHKALRPGGVFVFDTWFTPAVYTQKAEKRIRNFENENLKISREAVPDTDAIANVIRVHFKLEVTIKTGGAHSEPLTVDEIHLMRHFSIPEIGLFASSTGFEVLRAEEFLSGKEPGLDTWGVCFVLRKV